ncbi:MAG: hypothetical protein WDZ88_01115 [Candidatus Paceibacterota bacterium]
MTTLINSYTHREKKAESNGWSIAVLALLLVVGAGVYFWLDSRIMYSGDIPVDAREVPTVSEKTEGSDTTSSVSQ